MGILEDRMQVGPPGREATAYSQKSLVRREKREKATTNKRSEGNMGEKQCKKTAKRCERIIFLYKGNRD